MQIGDKELILVGDRILVKPDNPQEQTRVGLYLPQTVMEKEPVQTGRIIATGPGIAVPNFAADTSEPWQERKAPETRYIAPQAHAGDYALFLRKDAVEIQYETEKLLVIPQSSILLIVRDKGDEFQQFFQG